MSENILQKNELKEKKGDKEEKNNFSSIRMADAEYIREIEIYADGNIEISTISPFISEMIFVEANMRGKSNDNIRFDTSEEGRVAKIFLGSKDGSYIEDLNVSVTLPARKFKRICLKTKNGSIYVRNKINADEFEAETESGKIFLMNMVKAKNCKVFSNLGDIQFIGGVRATKLLVETNFGRISLFGNGSLHEEIFAEEMNIKTSNGDIVLNGKLCAEKVNIEDDFGCVTIGIDLKNNINFRITTIAGNVISKFKCMGNVKSILDTEKKVVEEFDCRKGKYHAKLSISTCSGKILHS